MYPWPRVLVGRAALALKRKDQGIRTRRRRLVAGGRIGRHWLLRFAVRERVGEEILENLVDGHLSLRQTFSQAVAGERFHRHGSYVTFGGKQF
jgi:hypothetical protein